MHEKSGISKVYKVASLLSSATSCVTTGLSVGFNLAELGEAAELVSDGGGQSAAFSSSFCLSERQADERLILRAAHYVDVIVTSQNNRTIRCIKFVTPN